MARPGRRCEPARGCRRAYDFTPASPKPDQYSFPPSSDPRKGPHLRLIRLIFALRYLALLLSALFFAWLLFSLSIHLQRGHLLAILPVIFGGLTALGVGDLIQKRHSVQRNYPILAHLRFLIEEIRPEIRQYLFESETDGAPFSRDRRALVYQRAKTQLDRRPFGAQLAVYSDGFEWMLHSLNPRPQARAPFRIEIGGPECEKPYSASVLNMPAMSFGALGYIKSLSCHTDTCPTGVATQDPARGRALHVPDKIERVANFRRRMAEGGVASFTDLYPALGEGELLRAARDQRLAALWDKATADRFTPLPA